MKTRLPKTFAEGRKIMHAIIETPQGSRNKFGFDRKSGMFWLKKVLPPDMQFPCDMGFIPGTKGDDGDPLDIMVLNSKLTFPGCVVPCRLIGVLQAEQTERNGKVERNDRYIAVPKDGHTMKEINELVKTGKEPLKTIIDFFTTYNRREGKKFEVLGVKGPAAARKMIVGQKSK
jgi:inorganic pyrophosphatase